VFRTEERLQKGLDRIRAAKERYKNVVIMDKGDIFNTDLTSAIEVGHILELAEVIILGALNRQESRGAHYRFDFPYRDDDKWLKHTLVYREGASDYRIAYRSVNITRYKPEERKY